MFDEGNRTAHPVDPDFAPVDSDRGVDEVPAGSLTEDIGALLEDGRTYLQAEVAYQKSRIGFVGSKSKQGLIYGLAALAFLHLALIGLVVGLIIALAPHLSAFGATALVVVALIIGASIAGNIALKRFGDAGAAIQDPQDD